MSAPLLHEYALCGIVRYLNTSLIEDMVEDSQDLLTMAARHELHVRENRENEMLLKLRWVYGE